MMVEAPVCASDGDRDTESLLAHYVTGRLDAGEIAIVEAWIAEDPLRRQARVAFERALAETVERRVQELPADIGMDRLLKAAASDDARSAPRPHRVGPGLRPTPAPRWIRML
jgi:anti-sigma factor RsiW